MKRTIFVLDIKSYETETSNIYLLYKYLLGNALEQFEILKVIPDKFSFPAELNKIKCLVFDNIYIFNCFGQALLWNDLDNIKIVLETRGDILDSMKLFDTNTYKSIIEKIKKHVDVLVVPSQRSLDKIMRHNIDVKKFIVNNRGATPYPRLERKRKYNKNIPLKLVTFSSNLWSRRFDRILDTALLLKKKGIDFQWHLVGGGSNNIWLDFDIKRLKLSDCVKNIGFISGPYIANLLSEYDLFIQLQEDEDIGFCMLDASASGLPCISTRDGCINEFFSDKKNAVFISQPYIENTVSTIESFIQDLSPFYEIAEAGRKMVEADHSFEHYVEKYENILF